MARIRTIKPGFFRHELLQELERAHAALRPMLVFAGLWGHCDKAGRFEWNPRTLKLDLLPFLDFDIAATLATLEKAGLVRRYAAKGRAYGWIPTFTEHQRIGGKEAQEPEKYPPPPMKKGKHSGSNGEATGKHSGSNREALGIAGREGKGREGKGKEGEPVNNSVDKSAWWRSRDGVERMGQKLGIASHPGELQSDYVKRLFAAIGARRLEKRSAENSDGNASAKVAA